jgi:hypothetical protein
MLRDLAAGIASDVRVSANAGVSPIALDEAARSHPLQLSIPQDAETAMLHAPRVVGVAGGVLHTLSLW